jgi:hypothetical protein
MAGNPLQKLLPYVKKYATQIWIASGFLLWLKMSYDDQSTYKWIYSENDFQRRHHLEQLRNYLKEEEERRASVKVAIH